MGESFLGFPNRFNIIGSLAYNPNNSDSRLDKALSRENIFNPNRPLSAFYGYRLSTEYLNRSGGKDFNMTGNFYTEDVIPNKKDINTLGTEEYKYHSVYATNFKGDSFSGNAASATKLKTKRTIKVTLDQSGAPNYECCGSKLFNGTEDIEIVVKAPYLHLKQGGAVNGKVRFYETVHIGNTLNTQVILPANDSDAIYNIGGDENRYNSIYAKTFKGALDGNAGTASSLLVPRSITLTADATNGGVSGTAKFDGSNDITIATKLDKKYLPLTGGTVTGGLTVNMGITAGTYVVDGVTYGSNITALGTQYTDPQTLELRTRGGVISTNVLVLSGIAYNTDAAIKSDGYSMQIRSIKGRKSGEYVKISSNGQKNDSGISGGGTTLSAYVDDLATNRLIASGCVENKSSSYNIDMIGDAIRLYEFQGCSTGPQWCVYSTDFSKPTGKLKCLNIIISDSDSSEDGGIDIGKNGHITLKQGGKIKINGSTNIGSLSDIREKTNISRIPRTQSSELISKLTPTRYNYITSDTTELDSGLIAQEAKLIYSKYNRQSDICFVDEDKNSGNNLMMAYMGFIPDLINTCQYLLAKVDLLEVNSGIKDSLEFPDLQKENTFDEAYYREHAEEIAMA